MQDYVPLEEGCLFLTDTKALQELAAGTPQKSQKQMSILTALPPAPQEGDKREPLCVPGERQCMLIPTLASLATHGESLPLLTTVRLGNLPVLLTESPKVTQSR